MTSIIIKNGSKEIYTATVTKDAREVRQLGGDHYIELSFSTNKILPFTKGCKIQAGVDSINAPMKWTLKRDAVPEPIQGYNGYRYVLRFYAKEHDMEDVLFKLEDDAFPGRPFRITTTLKGFCKLICVCLGSHWKNDESLNDTDALEISFEGENCREAAAKVAETFGVEWWVDYKYDPYLCFGKCEKGDEKVINEGEIVNRFPASKRGDDSNYGTRFYIFGGTTNVPGNYRYNEKETALSCVAPRRICLRKFNDDLGTPVTNCKGEPVYPGFYDAVSGLTRSQVIEKLIVLDDIYPKVTRNIEEVTGAYEDIGLENKVLVYTITSKDVLVSKNRIIGTVGITFTSGDLKGQSFDVNLIEPLYGAQTISYKKLEIVPRVENIGGGRAVITPGSLQPKDGDSYILTGVNVGDQEIQNAEKELWEKGRELADRYAADTNIYDCETNPVYCAEKNIKFDIGQRVVLMGAHFGTTGRKSRVQGYERKLYNPYIATYSIGDNTVYSRSLKMRKLINMTARVAEQSTLLSRNNAFQIRTGIGATPTTVAE